MQMELHEDHFSDIIKFFLPTTLIGMHDILAQLKKVQYYVKFTAVLTKLYEVH